MKENKNRFRISVAAFMLLCLAVQSTACASSDDTTTPQKTTEPAGTETEVVTEASVFPSYLGTHDFAGAQFRVGVSEDRVDYFYREETTGDILNDAVHESVRIVEETYNAHMVPIIYGKESGDITSYVTKTVNAGEDAYDLIMGHDGATWSLSMKNYYRDILDMPYQDLSQPWYPTYANDQYEINDKQYVFTSYMSYCSLALARAIFFNKTLAAEYQMDSLYEMVRNKTWTLDAMFELSRGVYRDLNGNGTRDEEDLYGWVANKKLYGMQGAYVNCYVEDNNGAVSLNYDQEKLVDVITTVVDSFHNNEGGYLIGNEPDITMFAQDRVLFTYHLLDDLTGEQMRRSETNYGILPVPLYDEKQESYVTPTFDVMISVPTSLPEESVERVSILLEAFGASGYNNIRETYFKTVLSAKYVTDEESIEMLNIIGDTLMVDLAYLNTSAGLSGLGRAAMYCISNPKKGISSYLASLEKGENKKIDQINEFFGGSN